MHFLKKKQDIPYQHSIVGKILVSFFIIAFTISSISFYISYTGSRDAIKETVRDELKTAAALLANQISGEDLLLIKPGDENSSQFLTLRDTLREKRAGRSELLNTYIWKKEGDTLTFLVDDDWGYSSAAAVGEVYQNTPETMDRIFSALSGPTADTDFTIDTWGTTLSGYAPIRDMNGDPVAILGVDMQTDTVINRMDRVSYEIFITLSLGLLIALLGLLFFSKQISRRIQRPEIAYRQLFEQSTDGIIIVQDQKIIAVNPAVVSLSTLPIEEIINTDPFNFIHPSYRQELIVKFNLLENNQSDYEIMDAPIAIGRGSDDHPLWVEFRSFRIQYHGKPAVQSLIRDITEIKEKDKALRESEERYATIVNNAPEPVLIHRNGIILFLNHTAEQTSQYSNEEICGTNIISYLTPPSQGEVSRSIAARLAGETIPEYEVEFIRKDGKILTFIVKATTISYQHEPAVLIHLSDITNRKATELKLQESEEMYRSLADTSPDAIILTDLQGAILFGNMQASTLFGYQSPAELLEKSLSDYIFIERPDLYEQYYHTVLTAGSSSADGCSAKQKNDSAFIVELSSSVIRDSNREVERFLNIMRDITEQVLLEKEMEYYHQEVKNHAEALARANRKLNLLSSITRHDILNQLTALSGYLNLVIEEDLDETVRKYLKKCQQASVFIQEQISFTKEYEEIGVNAPTWQNISDIVKNLRENSNLKPLHYHISVEGLAIYADPLLEKVFYTFVENSIRHGEKTTDVWFSYEISDDHLMLIYEDNGVGVRNNDKEMIFLKGYGKHTGFGLFFSLEILAITDMILRENGEPGCGVRFEIIVPYGMYRIG